jgi:hypothetical protein
VKQRLDNGDYLIQFEAGEELALTLIKPLQGIMWPTPSLTRFYVATSERKQKRDQEVAEQKRRLAQQHAKDTTKMLEQDREGRGARNCEQRELKFKKKAMAGAKKKEEQEAHRKMDEKQRDEEQKRMEAKTKLRKQKKVSQRL